MDLKAGLRRTINVPGSVTLLLTMANVELRNASEMLGMGGPWMGELHVDGILVDSQVMDAPMCDEREEWCVYVAYMGKPRWREDVRFRVNAYHIPTGKRAEFDLERDMLVLCEVRRDAAVLKQAFDKNYKCEVIRIPLPELDGTGAIQLPWTEIQRFY
jgi:hypothetical protein